MAKRLKPSNIDSVNPGIAELRAINTSQAGKIEELEAQLHMSQNDATLLKLELHQVKTQLEDMKKKNCVLKNAAKLPGGVLAEFERQFPPGRKIVCKTFRGKHYGNFIAHIVRVSPCIDVVFGKKPRGKNKENKWPCESDIHSFSHERMMEKNVQVMKKEWSVPELKQKLKALGLSTKGQKGELIQRIKEEGGWVDVATYVPQND